MNHINKMPGFFISAALFGLALAGELYAQTPRIAVAGAIDWKKMEITVNMALNLSSGGIRLPTGRARAEEILSVEFAGLARPYILAVSVDSSTSVEDLITRGNFPFLGPESIAGTAKRERAVLTPDFSVLSTTYTLDLSILSSQLVPHNRAMEIPRILVPVSAASYSGIVIIASGELPVHGRKTSAFALPCLFPKVWDSDMKLVYERNILDPTSVKKTLMHYASEADIFQDSPSGLSPELSALVGNNPLRIIAQSVFGIRPTDPIIGKEDALVILSSENNRRLLREGKIVIILGDDALRTSFKAIP